ncbi:MAG: hypothetical protein RL432_250 [Bacteroidota bacterium]|jgi:hypothetical protein
MKKAAILILFSSLSFVNFSQNLNWVRTVKYISLNPGAITINDVCSDENNRQYSISYGNNEANFSFNGNQISAPSSYTCGAIIKSNPTGNHEWIKFFNPVSGSCIPQKIFYRGGYIYIAGLNNGTVDMNPGAQVNSLFGWSTPFIVKLDTAGNFVWAKSFGEVNTKVNDIKVDGIGNVYITGSMSTSFFFNGVNQVSNGNDDIFLLKYNSLGQEQWCKTFGSNSINSECGNSIAIDQNNNINVCGFFSGSIDFDPGLGNYPLICNGQRDGFVSRFDANGNFLTAIRIGGNNTVMFNAIEVHNSTIYVAGSFTGIVDIDAGPTINNITVQAGPGVIMKFDYNFNTIWYKLFSTGSASGIYQMRLNSDKIYVSGILQSSTDLDPDPTNSFTYNPNGNSGNTFVVKLDSNGVFSWGAGFLNTDNAFMIGTYGYGNNPYGLSVTTNGVYIGGRFRGPVDFDPIQNTTQITQSALTPTGIGEWSGYLVKLGDCNSTSSSIQVNSCNAYTWAQTGQTYNTSGVFQDTLQNVNGCDSIISLNLTINANVQGGTTVQSACDSYTWNNQTYTQSGIYSQVLSTVNGCDSTVTLDLTLNYSPTTPIVTLSNVTNLTTPPQGNATYQWFQCSDNLPIANAVNNTFIASSNGLYGVIVSNGCGSDTSQCVNVSSIGLNELTNQMIIFPNPTSETIEIRMDYTELQYSMYKILDAQYREIKTGKLDSQNGKMLINIGTIASGNYNLVIEGVGVFNFIKN